MSTYTCGLVTHCRKSADVRDCRDMYLAWQPNVLAGMAGVRRWSSPNLQRKKNLESATHLTSLFKQT